MNIILVILDSLRRDHLGANGNDWIITPHFDAFAAEAVDFSQAYPESLPTLPVRRALHTGKRVYPFTGHVDKKGGFAGAPGWGPIDEDRTTVAELLREHGYRSALITDTYHQFKPSMNFHRGFDEWQWVRGQEGDPWRSGPPIGDEDLRRHIGERQEDQSNLRRHLEVLMRNSRERISEEDYFPARVFREASRWLWQNRDAEKVFMVVDSFDPHEPWDPPEHYRKLYDPDDDCRDVIQSCYGPWRDKLTPRELKRMQANYAGEVTLVDRWFGYFMEALRLSGRADDTIVGVISDHGHNVGHDPEDKGLVAKGSLPMTEAVARLVMMLRHPEGRGAGAVCDRLAYNFDLTATMLSLAGIPDTGGMDGIDLWPAATEAARSTREYVTVAWGPAITVIDETWWYNATIWGEHERLYRRTDDPKLERDLAGSQREVCEMMRQRAVDDAGGSIPDSFAEFSTRPGCTPFVH